MRAVSFNHVVTLATVALLGSGAAHANRLGNTYTKVASPTGCQGCHSAASFLGPTIDVTQVTPDPLVKGGTALFEIHLTSNRADPSLGFAAFAAGVTSTAGAFLAGTTAGQETQVCPTGGSCPLNFTATRDVTRRAWNNGEFTWQVELDNLGAGSFTMNVGANDVDGNGSSGGVGVAGDHNNHTTFAFVVGEGEGEGSAGEGEGEGSAGEGEGSAGEGEGSAGEGEGSAGEGEGEGGAAGGCSSTTTTTTGAPFAAVALLGLVGLRFTRRR